MCEQKLNTFLTANARLVHVVFTPSPTSYLSLVIAVGLGMKPEGRRLVRDEVGNKLKK